VVGLRNITRCHQNLERSSSRLIPLGAMGNGIEEPSKVIREKTSGRVRDGPLQGLPPLIPSYYSAKPGKGFEKKTLTSGGKRGLGTEERLHGLKRQARSREISTKRGTKNSKKSEMKASLARTEIDGIGRIQDRMFL